MNHNRSVQEIPKVKTIFIVEDDLSIQESLKEVLESEGYNVECAADGGVALSKLARSQELPSLILLDLMMPIVNGFEFRTQQLQNESLKDIPVVAMSADPRMVTEYRKLGSGRCLNKPIEVGDLLGLVQEFIK